MAARAVAKKAAAPKRAAKKASPRTPPPRWEGGTADALAGAAAEAERTVSAGAPEAPEPEEPEHDPFDGKLNDEQKRFVVTALACWETPTQVQKALKDMHGVDVTRQAIERYNPDRAAGKHLSEAHRELFAETRKQFLESQAAIGVAQQVVRLRRMEDAWKRARDLGNITLEMSIMEQASKEIGGAYTNKRELGGKVGVEGEIAFRPDLSNLTEAELEIVERLLGAMGNKPGR